MVDIHPLQSPWGRFHLYTFLVDAPEPAIVDTGIASSPRDGMAPALEALGRRIEDVRWILLTHGHIDHVGGAHALWELTDRKANIVIGAGDADFLRHRRTHVDEALELRGPWVRDPDLAAHKQADVDEAISGELEPTHLVSDGDTLDLGGVEVRVHGMAGHTPGAVAYEVDGAVLVGDTVQGYGAASGFPGYPDPDGYRAGLQRLAHLDPRRMYLGHPYRDATGTPYGIALDQATARRAVHDSLEHEARIRSVALRYLEHGAVETESPYSPFEAVATELGYTGNPIPEPAPFFTTLAGYRALAERSAADGSTPGGSR